MAGKPYDLKAYGQVLGHPSGLFVLFFTEMWERFSFYGMRVLLVNFLTMAIVGANPGWGWTAENAGALFGTYAGLLYLTPILGGFIADKFIGYRWAVVLGAAIMTLGHASMALETEFSLYSGLALLVIGTGFFKPNMTSIISGMYEKFPEKKDGAYTIFYMGVNAGAFFGMMLCGYLAEKIGWSWGFGLAGVFMLLGTLQFWLAKPIFDGLGDVPEKVDVKITKKEKLDYKPNYFTSIDKVLIAVSAFIGLGYLINDPLSKIANINMFPFEMQLGESTLSGSIIMALVGLVLFLFLTISRISRYDKIIRDRMIAVVIFAFFTVFFFMAFEQGATSLVIFARDTVNRQLIGGAALTFKIVNTFLTVVPLAIVTWVLWLLAKQTFKKISGSNIVLAICFLGIWGIVGWMLNRDFNTIAYDVSFKAIEIPVLDEDGKQKVDDDGNLVFSYNPITENTTVNQNDKVVDRTVPIGETAELKVGNEIKIITKNKEGTQFGYLDDERLAAAYSRGKELNMDSGVVSATINKVKDDEVEITVSWFSILNSFFIIAFASFFSKWWESKYNPSAAYKYAFGLILLGLGFGLLAIGSSGVVEGVKVSMIWLILAYLFHTLGELCLSPVGLSYVSKLVPGRMIAFMFGMWYLAIAIGNKLAGSLGGMIEEVTQQYDMSTYFLIFTIIPIASGVLVGALNPLLKKLMHGVR